MLRGKWAKNYSGERGVNRGKGRGDDPDGEKMQGASDKGGKREKLKRKGQNAGCEEN